MKILQKTALIMTIAISLLSSSCAGNNWNENQKAIIGGAGGAAVGGLIASALDASTAGVLGGAILGGLIGGAIGNRIAAADRLETNRATYRALESAPTGNTQTWKNPDSNNPGSITPTSTYQAQNGQYCRDYKQTITVSGETRQAFGTACRQPDGTWKVQ